MPHNKHITDHGSARMSQRGIREKDLDLLFHIGTEAGDGFVVLQRDYQDFERVLKRLIQRARRLVGKRVVIAEGKLITGYHATPGKMKRLLNKMEESKGRKITRLVVSA